MKARDVSVSVVHGGSELLVTVTMKLPGHQLHLELEPACPDPVNADATKYGKRVREGSRKRKQKELQRFLESMEFPDA